jgi:hypothetical protein
MLCQSSAWRYATPRRQGRFVFWLGPGPSIPLHQLTGELSRFARGFFNAGKDAAVAASNGRKEHISSEKAVLRVLEAVKSRIRQFRRR